MRKIEQIWIYPVKSLGGFEVKEAKVEKRGLQYDRRYMLTDENGRFVTQREHSQMALIKTRINTGGFEVMAPGKNSIVIPYEIPEAPTKKVLIWKNECEARLAGSEYDEFFSDILKNKVHLVYMHDDCIRPVNPLFGELGDITSFNDGYPVLVMTTASLENLNGRLEDVVGWDRFRPSVVVRNTEPFEEDVWKKITLGDASFKIVKPCSRCVVTTIDQQTGISSKEPLRTLSTFRKVDNYVNFGQNAIPENPGSSIRKNDECRIQM